MNSLEQKDNHIAMVSQILKDHPLQTVDWEPWRTWHTVECEGPLLPEMPEKFFCIWKSPFFLKEKADISCRFIYDGRFFLKGHLPKPERYASPEV